MIYNCKRLDGLFSVVHIMPLSLVSDDHTGNYFEFLDEESECPTEFSEETVMTSATASECANASASVTMATSRPTRTQY